MTRVVQAIQDSLLNFRDSAVAIGIFDGVHVGHQEILRQTAREAHTQGYSSVVLTFDRHAAELLSPDSVPTYINSLDQRADLLHSLSPGLDTVAVARFDNAFASLEPDEFIEKILIAKLSAKHVLIGADFCYGKGRKGNVTSLLEEGAKRGFAVTVVPPVMVEGQRISSTEIRNLISSGLLEEARNLLGHHISIRGSVVKGKQLGRTIGFPTANLSPHQINQQIPRHGVYGGYVHVLGDGRHRAAISIGTNPATDSDDSTKIEAYIMDGFDQNIYGNDVDFEISRFIRPQKWFSDLATLSEQITADVRSISSLLGY